MPKPIAPNPWRRGRRRTGGHSAQGDGAPQSGHSPSMSTTASTPAPAPRSSAASGAAASTDAPKGRPQVIGLFANRASAELACRALAERGYREDAIKLMISEETCARYFSDYGDRVHSLAGGAIDREQRPVVAFSHRPRQCPATLDVAIYTTTPNQDATATLAEILSGSGLPYSRIAEYETALHGGAVLLSVHPRSHDDARLIEIEWRRSYRAEKVHS